MNRPSFPPAKARRGRDNLTWPRFTLALLFLGTLVFFIASSR